MRRSPPDAILGARTSSISHYLVFRSPEIGHAERVLKVCDRNGPMRQCRLAEDDHDVAAGSGCRRARPLGAMIAKTFFNDVKKACYTHAKYSGSWTTPLESQSEVAKFGLKRARYGQAPGRHQNAADARFRLVPGRKGGEGGRNALDCPAKINLSLKGQETIHMSLCSLGGCLAAGDVADRKFWCGVLTGYLQRRSLGLHRTAFSSHSIFVYPL
jgi:hypothetical protein